MYCSNCGNKCEIGSYCTSCGSKVRDSVIVKKDDGLRTGSIILGSISIFCSISLVFSIYGILLSIVGFILALCSLKNGKNILGIVLNVLGFVIPIIIVLLLICLGMWVSSVDDSYNGYVDEYREYY